MAAGGSTAEEQHVGAPAGPVVAISATYGAGGDEVGAQVAEGLGVPLLGHTFTSAQMEEAYAGSEHDPPSAYLQHRVRGDQATDDGAARSAVVMLGTSAQLDASDEDVRALVATGGVVVGRAGPHVLRDHPHVLRVLLDGPRAARVAAGAALEGVDRATAERRQRAHDASRDAIARTHYGVDPDELRLYAVVLDTTVLGLDAAVTIVTTAARAMQQRTDA